MLEGRAAQTGEGKISRVGIRTGLGQSRVECTAAPKAGRSQGGCIIGAGWNAMQGKLGAERE